MSKAVFYAMDERYLQEYIDGKNQIAAAVASGKISAEMIDRVKAEMSDFHAEQKKELYTVDDQGIAHITVAGPLEPKPDPCAVMFDIEMTTYSDIIEATRKAEADPRVISKDYHFSTPGGNVVGLFRAADEIYAGKKPKRAIVHSLCASAGYALASQCDSIEGENISCEIGSIGVKTEMVDTSKADTEIGIRRYILTSSNAENKSPDVTTIEGRDKIIARLDDMENVFVEYVARGRNVSKEKILSDFGRGGVMISRDALRAGMIDGIITDIKTLPAAMPATEPGEIDTKKKNCQTAPNATASDKKTKGETSMEMTTEALESFGKKIAADTAASVTASMTAEFQARDAARAADETRKAGFKPLYDKFPNQKAMIDAEIEKEGATASATFALTVAEAETARLAALSTQEADAAANIDPLKGKSQKADTSGDDFLASMGVTARKEA